MDMHTCTCSEPAYIRRYNCSKLAWAVSVLFYRGCTGHVCVVKTANMHILLHSKCKENITTHLAMSLKNYSRSYIDFIFIELKNYVHT